MTMKRNLIASALATMLILAVVVDCQRVEPKYSIENLKSLAIQDAMRWLTIMEDVVAEYTHKYILDGVLDKKSIKIAMRFAIMKLKQIAKQQGYEIENYALY